MFIPFGAVKEPVMVSMPGKVRSPVACVAMAIEPEKVVQLARAEASPPFWIVAVAWLQMLEEL